MYNRQDLFQQDGGGCLQTVRVDFYMSGQVGFGFPAGTGRHDGGGTISVSHIGLQDENRTQAALFAADEW